jgi:hypothetical protein
VKIQIIPVYNYKPLNKLQSGDPVVIYHVLKEVKVYIDPNGAEAGDIKSNFSQRPYCGIQAVNAYRNSKREFIDTDDETTWTLCNPEHLCPECVKKDLRLVALKAFLVSKMQHLNGSLDHEI